MGIMDKTNEHTRYFCDIGVITEPTIVISDVTELLEERIKLRNIINNCLNMMGARTVHPIINPSIALYVKRNTNKKEKVEKIDKEMQSLLTKTSNWDRSIIKHSHQQQMDIIDHRNNFLLLNKNKNSLRKDLDINESVMISSNSDIELPNKETHEIFQYNRRDCQGQNIAHIFPTAIMNIDSKAPQVIYASQRKSTNRDRKRKHVSRRTLFGMHCKNDSIRKNIFQLPHESPFCMNAEKKCDCVRSR